MCFDFYPKAGGCLSSKCLSFLLIMAPRQKLVLASGATIKDNMVIKRPVL